MGIAIPQVVTEDRASGAQVIDGALRFDSRKSQRLTRTPSSAGNRKTWTWSAWVKTVPGAFSASNHKNLFSVDGGGADATRMHMFIGNASDKLQHDLHASSPRVSSSVYRDVSGWYHVVVKFDSTQSTARNQIAWYINGQQVVNWDTENSITQNNDFGINGAYLHAIGSNLAAGPGQFFDGLMSQVYLIDGQALDPSYFGYTDPLTNTWRPKKFSAFNNPNNAITWSNSVSGTALSGYGKTNAFDGSTATTCYPDRPGTLTFTPPTTLTGKVGLWFNANTGGSDTASITINGVNVSSTLRAYQTSQGTTPNYYEFDTFDGLTSIVWEAVNGFDGWGIQAITVGGYTLLDAAVDNSFYLPLDGNTPIGQDQSGNGNNWTPVNFGGSNTIEKATGALPILNTNDAGTVAIRGVRTDKKTYTVTASGGKYYLDGVETPTLNFLRGGTYIFDYTGATSHPFKFSTTSDGTHGGGSEYTDGTNTATSNVMKITVPHNAPDTLYYYCSAHSGMGSSINVTTDIFRADPYAWKCMFAMASDAIDISPEINVNSTASVFTDVHTNNPQRLSNFYGTSKKMESGGGFRIDWQSTSANSNAKHQWSGDFTIECWHWSDGSNTSWHSFFRSSAYNDTSAEGIAHYGNGQTLFPYRTTGNYGQTGNVIFYKQWNHTAWTREGSTGRIFVNGVLVKTFTDSNTYDNRGFEIGDVYSWNGGYQDARIYNGVAKYTQNFIPASTDPDILPDTPSGVAGGSALTKITDGAVSFDGSGDYLSLASSADFALGTNDWTIEYFAYPTSTTSYQRHFYLQGGDSNQIEGIFADASGISFGKTNVWAPTQVSHPINQWNHYALVHDSTNMRLYINGIQVLTSTDNFADENKSLNIGYSNSTFGGYFTGFMSNFRIVKGTALYTSNFTPPTAPITSVANTKLLCAQSNTSAGTATVAPAIANNPNDGSIWSQVGTRSGTLIDWTSGFDGSRSTQTSNSSNTAAVITFNPVIPCSTATIWGNTGGSTAVIRINGTSVGGDGQNANPLKQLNTVDVSAQGGVQTISLQGTSDGYAAKMGALICNPGAGEIDAVNGAKEVIPVGNAAATNFNPFTTDINAVRGQESGYATLNPLFPNPNGGTYSNGNLRIETAAGNGHYRANFAMSTGRWYWETTPVSGATPGIHGIGNDSVLPSQNPGNSSGSFGYYSATGYKQTSGTDTAYGSTYTYGDVIGCAYDASNGKVYWSKNGIWQGGGDPVAGTNAAFTSATNTPYYPLFCAGSSVNTVTVDVNFGQKPFKFPPPDGFQPLNASTVRPSTVIARPDQYVKPVIYSGTGAERNIDLGFDADFVWLRKRSGDRNTLIDTVRGDDGTKMYCLVPELTATEAERTESTAAVIKSSSWPKNGIRVGTNGQTNSNGLNYFAWGWKAGGRNNTFNVDDVGYATASAAGLNVGNISLNGASVGTKQGLSILTWTGSGGQGNLPHGLTQDPDFIVIKGRNNTNGWWQCWHRQFGTGSTVNRVYFNSTTGSDPSSTNMFKPNPGAGTILLNTGDHFFNSASYNYIGYVWHNVPGLQKFGSYVGNTTAGPFVELGFRPAILWIKCVTQNWYWAGFDVARNPYNPNDGRFIQFNNSDGEASGVHNNIDFLSNGFRVRSTSVNSEPTNLNGETYIYCAWAEAPTFNLYGAQSNAR